jgi:hypothetical protein
MKTITITVEDQENAHLLAELAKQLSFVRSVEISGTESPEEIPTGKFASEEEFLELVGLWKNRDVNVETIREKAWRRINL